MRKLFIQLFILVTFCYITSLVVSLKMFSDVYAKDITTDTVSISAWFEGDALENDILSKAVPKDFETHLLALTEIQKEKNYSSVAVISNKYTATTAYLCYYSKNGGTGEYYDEISRTSLDEGVFDIVVDKTPITKINHSGINPLSWSLIGYAPIFNKYSDVVAIVYIEKPLTEVYKDILGSHIVQYILTEILLIFVIFLFTLRFKQSEGALIAENSWRITGILQIIDSASLTDDKKIELIYETLSNSTCETLERKKDFEGVFRSRLKYYIEKEGAKHLFVGVISGKPDGTRSKLMNEIQPHFSKMLVYSIDNTLDQLWFTAILIEGEYENVKKIIVNDITKKGAALWYSGEAPYNNISYKALRRSLRAKLFESEALSGRLTEIFINKR